MVEENIDTLELTQFKTKDGTPGYASKGFTRPEHLNKQKGSVSIEETKEAQVSQKIPIVRTANLGNEKVAVISSGIPDIKSAEDTEELQKLKLPEHLPYPYGPYIIYLAGPDVIANQRIAERLDIDLNDSVAQSQTSEKNSSNDKKKTFIVYPYSPVDHWVNTVIDDALKIGDPKVPLQMQVQKLVGNNFRPETADYFKNLAKDLKAKGASQLMLIEAGPIHSMINQLTNVFLNKGINTLTGQELLSTMQELGVPENIQQVVGQQVLKNLTKMAENSNHPQEDLIKTNSPLVPFEVLKVREFLYNRIQDALETYLGEALTRVHNSASLEQVITNAKLPLNRIIDEIKTLGLNDPQELKELVLLERKNDVMDKMRALIPETRTLDRTLIRWLTGVILRSKNSQQAVEHWRALIHRGGRTEKDFNQNQMHTINNIEDSRIQALYDMYHEMEQQEGYMQDVINRAISKVRRVPGHRSSDLAQKEGKMAKNLEYMQSNKIQIMIESEDLSRLVRIHREHPDDFLLELVKNDKVLTVNGFRDSKASLSIHDTFDHVWNYSLLDEAGIFDRYKDFFNKLHNPQDTDMFGRESEFVASIAFDWRSSHLQERNFTQILSFDKIKQKFEKAENSNTLTENQRKAKELLNQLNPESEEAKRLAVVCSGVAIELMEQRRLYGGTRNFELSTEEGSNILPLFDMEYLSLIVESIHLIESKAHEGEKIIYNTEVMVEDFLEKSINEGKANTLEFSLDDVLNFNPDKSSVDTKKRKWLEDHLYHIATRVPAKLPPHYGK